MENINYCALPARRTLLNRLGFGSCLAPEAPEIDGYAPGALSIDTTIKLSFIDRLRVLLTGNLMVRTRVKTDVIVDHAQSYVSVSVLPFSADQ